MAQNEIAVKATDIKKTFRIPLEASNGIKQKLINAIKGRKGYREFSPLNGISFEINRGDFFGIVGRNGSGKSTLLKTIAGIYAPNGGAVQVNGTLVPFIELGVGFNPELTGRENVFLNGALLGFSHTEMEAMYDEIVEFAELYDFMEERLKNYSSGMQVRLAFSIAIKAEGDILLLDEVLAVGDEAFQRKCNKFFEKVKQDKSKTIILVTHSMDDVKKYCNKAMMIDKGRVVSYGSPDVVADEYSLENINSSNERSKRRIEEKESATIDVNLLSRASLKNDETLELEVTYKNDDNRKVYPKVVINFNSVPVMASNAKILYNIVTADTKEHKIHYSLPLDAFNQGEISIVALLVDSVEEVNIAEFGYDGSLNVKIANTKTGTKIGGIIRDMGKMESIK